MFRPFTHMPQAGSPAIEGHRSVTLLQPDVLEFHNFALHSLSARLNIDRRVWAVESWGFAHVLFPALVILRPVEKMDVIRGATVSFVKADCEEYRPEIGQDIAVVQMLTIQPLAKAHNPQV